jgi:hypothetical protein
MAYLLIEKLHDGTDFVLLGPMEWRPRFFQSCLRDDLEIDFNVPLSNDTGEAIIVNEIARIIPVTDIGITGEFNPKIHHLIGPYYNFYDTYAEMYHTVQDKPIEVVREELKSIIASNRYKYEILGININIQDKDISLLTTRADRGLYLQAYQLGTDSVNWKFGTEFLTLSNIELGTIVQAIILHVQSAFDWEANKIIEIDSMLTLEDLNNASLVSDNIVWEPIPFQMDLNIPNGR